MSVPVPFGQFVPGDSPVHRLDPRVKIALTLAFTVVLFASRGWTGLAIGAVAVALVLLVSRVALRIAARGLTPIAWLLAFTIIANGLTYGEPNTALHIGSLGVSAVGATRGAFFAVRIALLVLGTSVITLTTSPVALTDALSQLMRPLRYLAVPVDDAAMMFSIALHFIPTTAEEAEKIVVAQTARGARFDDRGPVRRARAWVPVLVPLFVNLFRRADDLAIAMETRCYTGRGRSRLHERTMRPTDWAVLLVGVTVSLAAVILLS
jgi:energy-coupling factor transport system permease protein